MIKKWIVAFGAVATTAGLMVAAAPAEARPHMVCKRVWAHGHPERRCHPVGPMRRHY